jgi:hypothetical protein
VHLAAVPASPPPAELHQRKPCRLKRKRQKPCGLWRLILEEPRSLAVGPCPCGAAVGSAFAYPRPCLEPAVSFRCRPALPDPTFNSHRLPCPAALPSVPMPGSRPASSPPALPQIRLAPDPWGPAYDSHRLSCPCGGCRRDWLTPTLRPCLEPAFNLRLRPVLRNSTCDFSSPVRFSGCRLCPGSGLRLCPGPSGFAFRRALRPSLRLCLPAAFPLRACAPRFRSTLRPPSSLRSAQDLRPASSRCLPASHLACSLRRSSFRLCTLLKPALWYAVRSAFLARLAPCVSSQPFLRAACPACAIQSTLRHQPSVRSFAFRLAPRAWCSSLPARTSGLSTRPACALSSPPSDPDLIRVRLAPPASSVRPSSPASASPSSASRLAPGSSLRVFRSEPALRLAPLNQLFRCLSDRPSALGLRPLLPFDPPACLPERLQACALCRPFQLAFAVCLRTRARLLTSPAPPRACRLLGTLGSRLVPADWPLSNLANDLLRGHQLERL